jgi:hypothetical protein
MDQERNETARRLLVSILEAKQSIDGIAIEQVVDATNMMHAALEKTQPTAGHPAETALEQLFDLLASHDDKLLMKWVKANANVRRLKELCTYLGAEREP